jgi:hypothetical protein
MDAIIQSISRARQILRDEDVDVRGLAFDGDTKYLSFLRPFERQVERIQEFNLHRPLSGIIINNGPGIFEDVLHLLKAIRYRYVTPVHHFPLPFAITATITRESWRFLGISDNLLNDNQAHKQEDELAMKFLIRAIEVKRFDLFLCLLPWVFLKHAIFVEEYSRTQQTTFLAFGFAISLVHFHLLIEQKKRRMHQTNKSWRGPNLRRDQILKALNSMFYADREIVRNKLLDVRPLGTNQEKHFLVYIALSLMATTDLLNLSRIQLQLQ